MDNSLTRPLAVVTGASSGIGYELAFQFAQNGFDLLVTATGPSIKEAALAFEGLGAKVETVEADLATYDGVETLYSQIQATGRPVDAIAINAGVGVGGDFARETDLKDELNLINLNVMSSVHLAKRVVKDMVERGNGRILFTSSIAAIMPGPTDTNFFHHADMDDTKVGVSEKDDPAEVAKQGFDALIAGKDNILAGSLKTKLQGIVSKVLPETVKTEQHRHLSEPGSDNK